MSRRGRAPVGHTCPDIDRAISSITDILEDLSQSNSALRSWGEEEAARVDVLEDEVSTLLGRIEELEADISDLKEQLQVAQHVEA